MPMQGQMAKTPVPVKSLFLLERHLSDRVDSTTLEGAEKFTALQQCLYGPLLAIEHASFFPLLAAVARQVTIVRIRRSAARWSVPEVVNEIMAHC